MICYTAVNDVVYRSIHVPREVAEKAEHCETGENSREEIHQRNTDSLTVKHIRHEKISNLCCHITNDCKASTFYIHVR